MDEKKKSSHPVRKESRCEECMHFTYDDEFDAYVCEMDLDQDEMESFLRGQTYACVMFEAGDEYKIVRHQM